MTYRIKEYKGKFTVQKYKSPTFWDYVKEYIGQIYDGWRNVYFYIESGIPYREFNSLKEAEEKIKGLLKVEVKPIEEPKYHYPKFEEV